LKVIFVDINGVLLPSRAWALPQNRVLASARRSPHSAWDAAKGVVFEPIAVALLNRLCRKAGASVVVHSNWRRNVGFGETRAKLIGQGVEEVHFHAQWACPRRFTSQKFQDISSWLADNRAKPGLPVPPAGKSSGARATMRVRTASPRDHGIDFVILDDEPMGFFEDRRIVINGDEGFGLAAYRHACGHFGAADAEFGVSQVTDDDLETVTAAWRGDRLRAALWLHESRPGGGTRAQDLDAARIRGMASDLHWQEDPEAVIARRRAEVMEELKSETRRMGKRPYPGGRL